MSYSGFHNTSLAELVSPIRAKSAFTPRVHIESAKGTVLISGRLIDKDENHVATIKVDGGKWHKIDLSNYVRRANAMFPNTIYFRRTG